MNGKEERPLVEIDLCVPEKALLRSGVALVDLDAEKNGLSLSEDGVKINVHPLGLKSASTQSLLTDPALWVVASIATGACLTLGAKIADKIWEKLSEVFSQVRWKTGATRLFVQWDVRLPVGEGSVIVNVHSDDNSRNILLFLNEDVLAEAIRKEAPLDDVALAVLRFHDSPPRLEVKLVIRNRPE